MKRYWLLRGNSFYPLGGMEDFFDHSDDLEDLKEHIHDMEAYEWAHIFDTQEFKIILQVEINEDNQMIWGEKE